LKLVESRTFDCGIAAHCYEPQNSAEGKMDEKNVKAAFFSRRIFLQASLIGGAGLLINCRNSNQNGGLMSSNTKTNTATSAEQEATGKGEYAEVNGLKMYYEIHGAGQPLLLLHGSWLSATVYPALLENRQVIAADMQGHGRTADIERPFSYEQMADDAAALLRRLNIEQTDVFGYSMGGTIGLALAIRHRALVRRLAVFGAIYRPISEVWSPEMIKGWNAITPESPDLKDLKEQYEKLSPAPNWKSLVEKVLQMEKDFKGFSQEQMKAIKAEVFISAGDHNDTSAEHLAEMHKLIPKSQLAVFPNTEHVIMMTDPDKVLPPIKEFLNGGV
jgi:pimeloyl-ACP methyl ester carboxylesterase